MNLAEPYSHTISRLTDNHTALDQKKMVSQGIKEIEKMAGGWWSNFNPSDPGITMLDLLCYGLLNLGYQSEFPIEDILTGDDQQIDTQGQFYTPREIMFTNPVTINDFRKLILDKARAVKNVWITKTTSNSKNGAAYAYSISYELSDDFKLAWSHIKGNDSKATMPENKLLQDKNHGDFQKFCKPVTDAIRSILYKHRNLGDQFTDPEPMLPQPWQLECFLGAIYLEQDAVVESVLAEVYYTINNYLSPYIRFSTYHDLIEEGQGFEQIMQGPCMANGYISDSLISQKPGLLDDPELKSILAGINGVQRIEYVQSIPPNTVSAFHDVYFDWSTAAASISQLKMGLYLGVKQLLKTDQSELNSEYYKLTATTTFPSGMPAYLLGPTVPKGTFRDIAEYHSVQPLFPAFYGLGPNEGNGNQNPQRQGQVNQLRAYLMLFEQLIANHQAQLAGLGQLLNHHDLSDLNSQKPTYLVQGLFSCPGALGILKAFDQYQDYNRKSTANPQLNRQSFIEDQHSSYLYALQSIQCLPEENTQRLDQILTHLLARYGDRFDLNGIINLNPNYGNYHQARVQGLSDLLNQYDLVSENIDRSYFRPEGTEEPLFSGLERKLGLVIQLNACYEGLLDLIGSYLESHEQVALTEHLSTESTGQSCLCIETRESKHGDKIICLVYYGEPIILLSKAGSVLFNARQLEHRWVAGKVLEGDKPEEMSLSIELPGHVDQVLSYLKKLLSSQAGEAPAQATQDRNTLNLQFPGKIYSDGTGASDISVVRSIHWYGIDIDFFYPINEPLQSIRFNMVRTLPILNHELLEITREALKMMVAETKGFVLIDGRLLGDPYMGIGSALAEALRFQVFIVLPATVMQANTAPFHELLQQQCAQEGPLTLKYNIVSVSSLDMIYLISYYKIWLKGLEALQMGENTKCRRLKRAREAARVIINIIQPQHHQTA